MLKLMLFELKRKWKLNLVIVMLYQLANLYLVYRLKEELSFNVHDDLLGLVYLFGASLPLLSFVDAINSLRKEVKNPTRDLYFTLPTNGFEKIGSKIVVALISMTTAVLIVIITVLLSTDAILGSSFVSEVLKEIPKRLNELSYFVTLIIMSYAMFIGMVYMAFALQRSFFSQWKFGGMVTFVLFIGTSYVVQYFLTLIAKNNQRWNIDFDLVTSNAWVEGFYALLVTVIFAGIIYTITSLLFEHRANFD